MGLMVLMSRGSKKKTFWVLASERLTPFPKFSREFFYTSFFRIFPKDSQGNWFPGGTSTPFIGKTFGISPKFPRLSQFPRRGVLTPGLKELLSEPGSIYFGVDSHYTRGRRVSLSSNLKRGGHTLELFSRRPFL